MNKIIEQAVAEAKPNIEAQKHKVTVDLDDDLPKTFSDVDRITEVVINLLGNSIKYTPPQGKIKITSRKDDKYLKVSVADNGIGISREGKEKIFGKFEQGSISRDERKGTGLGLYIVKNLIELHKGKIWVESREGRGSTFSFTLPILKEQPPDEHASEGGVLRLNK
jgi:signal transduction histidine kinase